MRKSILLFAGLMLTLLSYAQNQNPVQWSFTSKKINSTTFEVRISANIDKGWHIYSQSTPDGGPVATSISFTKNPLIKLNHPAKEVGKLEKHFEPLFDVDVLQFSNQVDFVQIVTVKPNIKTNLSGNVEYMVCNDHECLPPTSQKFTIDIK